MTNHSQHKISRNKRVTKDDSLGPWRLRVIFILNVLFSCRRLISVMINIQYTYIGAVIQYIIERNVFAYWESNPLLILLTSSGYANGLFTRK
jgi:hypothetical protein